MINRAAALALSGVAAIGAAVVSAGMVRDAGSPGYSMISTSTPPATTLAPNEQGYVRVEMKSGSLRCSITRELVACQTAAGSWPRRSDGRPFHAASITADGEFHWVDADLGALAGRVTLDQGRYSAQGWTIVTAPDRATFTNDDSGHGMSASDQAVEPF